VKDPFDPEEVVDANVMVNGYRLFEDSLGVCNFNSVNPPLTVECVNAITGWDFNLADAINVGLRTLHHLRMFNLRHGQDISLEAPSKRYGSAPSDGPCKGKSIFPHWEKMRVRYYAKMGWDLDTGWPLEETLRRLELDDLITDLPSSFG
jgi:aldehyde:ferredoxin oxidoreductase